MNIQELRDEIMLENHLRYNFYPPINVSFFLPICKEAIEAVNNGDNEKLISGVPAGLIIGQFHLEDCITNPDAFM
jgi:hypothetical protein